MPLCFLLLPSLSVCAGVGIVVVVLGVIAAVVIVRRRRAAAGGGDGLGGLDQPILDKALDGSGDAGVDGDGGGGDSVARSSW